MRVAVITGGVGGARFLRGLEALTHTPQWADLSITAVANIGDDITLHDLRICPDLDTVMYTLGGGIDDAFFNFFVIFCRFLAFARFSCAFACRAAWQW